MLAVFTGLHNYYGKHRQWKAYMASLFCHSLNTVELRKLIVGGSSKIIPFPITKKHFKNFSILHEKALT